MGDIAEGIVRTKGREDEACRAAMACVGDVKRAIEAFSRVPWGDMEGTNAAARALVDAAGRLEALSSDALGRRDELRVLMEARRIVTGARGGELDG